MAKKRGRESLLSKFRPENDPTVSLCPPVRLTSSVSKRPSRQDSNAEANMLVAAVRRFAAGVRAAAVPGGCEPAAAAHGAGLVLIGVFVFTPLPHVAVHIAKAPGVRCCVLVATHFGCAA